MKILVGQKGKIDLVKSPTVLLTGQSEFVEPILSNIIDQIEEDIDLYFSDKNITMLEFIDDEMRQRYLLFAEAGIKNFEDYEQPLNRIVVVFENLEDDKETDSLLKFLAGTLKRTGIHLLLTTQNESLNIAPFANAYINILNGNSLEVKVGKRVYN